MEKLDALLIRIRNLNHFTRSYQEDEQLGLLYIATYCRQQGSYAVSVLDEYSITLDLLKRTLDKSEAKVVGFYCDHENIWAVIKSISYIKEVNPSTLCVVGGPQVSARPWTTRVFEETPVDIVVICDGEDAFLEILDVWVRGKGSFSDVTGIVFRNGKTIYTNPPRELERNLDKFPIPDRSLNYYGKKASGNENLVTARGCPYRCAFCFEGRPIGVRARTPESILEEVEMLLQDRGMRYLAILDDLFTLNRKRVLAVCEGFKRLQDQYHEFVWFCEGRVDVICKYPEIVSAMRKVGLLRMQIGVESGSQLVLDAYRKGITVDQIRECVDICYEADVLSVIGNVIIGGAFEDRGTLQATQDLVCDLMKRAPGCYDFNTTIFTPYPGTAMFENPEDYGLRIIDRDCISGMGDNYAFAESEALTKWEILDARHNLMEAFEATATALIPCVGESRRLRHFSAFYLYGIETIWFQVMAGERRFYNYYGLQVSSGKRAVGSVDHEMAYDLKPIRTINIGSSLDGQLILPYLSQPMKLNKLGSRILEMSCGKLTVRQMVDSLWAEMGKSVDREAVDRYVFATLARFDEERLVLLSET